MLAVQKEKAQGGAKLSAGSGQGLLSYCCSSANGEATYRVKQKTGARAGYSTGTIVIEKPRDKEKKKGKTGANN